MNNSTSHNMSTSQPQRNDGSALGEFFSSGLQAYANYPPENETAQEEFMWDPSLFTNPQIFSPPAATHTPAWTQNAAAQSRDPPLTAYGGLQSSFQLSQYGQPSFDPRQPSPQPAHDPRLISQPSPSPTQYSHNNPQSAMLYRDLSYQNQQQFNPQSMVYPQRPNSTSTPTYDGHANRSPYFNYNSHMAGQSHLQPLDLTNSLGGFPEQQQQRPAAPFIDPSFLTANGLQRQRIETAQNMYPFLRQENVQTQAGGQHTSLSTMSNHVQGSNIPTSQTGAFMGVFVPNKTDKAAAKARKPKDPNAPKRPRGRPRKDASQPSTKQGTDASTSDSDSDELQVEEMPEPLPDLLRGPRPDTADKVIYDVAFAVWSPRNKPAVAEKVRAGIALFGDVVKQQRDAWKVKNEALKQAELANTTAIPSLKQEVAQFRKTIETMANQALHFGHPAHLAKLGENPFTMSALQSFLVDRINALDMDGDLLKSILKLMDRFTTLDEEMLEKTKTSKILTRLTKKAGNEVRVLAQSVLDHAASASKKKAASSTKAEGGDSPMATNDQRTTSAGGLKRPREAEGGSLPATKRTVVPTTVKQASKPLALQNAERKKLELAATKAKNPAPVVNGTSSTAPAAASKAAVAAAVPPKPSPSPFSALMSASKKPGTSIAARAAAAKEKASATPAPITKKPSPPPPAVIKSEPTIAPVTKSTFSFMDTLADMSRPKQIEEKKVDDRPPETEEEREKRLRKEERRKLRVSWAPENELTQIKLFVHDPEEEIGQADSAMRDVDDVGGEGRMLKLHKDLDDLDDDDDGRANAEDMEPYRAPTEVDFGVIDEEARTGSFIRRGGTEKPESAEKEAQDLREQTTLMVVYALPSDVPPTPKEPPAAGDEDDYTPITSFGEPEEKTRQSEKQYYEQMRASSQQAAAPTPDLNAILNLMKQNQQQPAQQPTYNTFAPQPAPQQQPAQGVDISKILAVMSQMQQPQPQAQPVIPAQPQQQGSQVNLAALLAQMQGQTQPAQPAQTTLPYGYTGNPNPYPGTDTDYSRKHGRNESVTEYDDYAWKKKKAAIGTGGTGGSIGSAKPHPKAKTVICKFWQEGKCKKGDDCTFIHE